MSVASTMALALVLAAPAADEVPLSWDAPSGCPDADAVQQRLSRALADAPPDSRRRLDAAATVSKAEDGMFSLQLQLSGDGVADTRALQSTDCRELADAAVLIVALAVDPTVLDRGGLAIGPPPADPAAPGSGEPGSAPPEPTVGEPPTADPSEDPPTASEDPATAGPAEDPPTASEDPATAGPATDDPDPSATTTTSDGESFATDTTGDDTTTRDDDLTGDEPSERSWGLRRGRRVREPRARRAIGPLRLGLRAMAGVGLGVLASPTADIAVAATLARGLWRVELGATYWTPQEEPSPVNPAVGGVVQAWAVEPRGCLAPSAGPVEFPICIGVDLGAIHGRGAGDVRSFSRASAWITGAAGAGVVLRPPKLAGGRLGFWLRGEVLPTFTVARFGTPQSGVIFRQPSVGGRVGGGLEVSFALLRGR